MAFGDLFRDYPSSVERLPTLRPEQLELQNKLLGSASGILAEPSNQFNFAPLEQRAREQFQRQTVPGIAARFLGQGNVQNSSAFQGALGSAASDLETNLAALGSEYGLKRQELQQGQLRNLLGYGLTPSFENIYTPPQPGFAKTIAPSVIGAGTQIGAQALGNYLGARGSQAAIQAATQQQQAAQPIMAPEQQQPGLAGTVGQAAAGTAAGAVAGKAAGGFMSKLGKFLGLGGKVALGAAGAGLGAWGAYKLVKRIQRAVKEGRADKAKRAQAYLEQLSAYREGEGMSQFPEDFPRRGKSSLNKWYKKILKYQKKHPELTAQFEKEEEQ